MSIATTSRQRLQRSRRAFLRTVGGAATSLPFYRLLESSAVHAAPGDLPQRFVGLYAPHGISEPFYNRRPNESDTSFSFDFPDSVLQPFESRKNQVTVIQGMDLSAGIEKSTNGHKAACVILTGSGPVGDKPANESLDQFLAVTHGLGAQTRFASVVLGVGTRKTDSGENISYARGGAPLPKTIDPSETFNLLFSNLVVSNDPAAQAGLERARLRGKSLLDFLRKDIARLEPRLAPPEKLKLEQHTSSLRELEKQLVEVGAAPTAGCRSPARPNPAEFPKLQIYNGGEPYLDKITELQLELLAQALACDLTRFGTLFIGLTEEFHNGIAHQYDGPRGERSPGNVDTQVALARHNRHYYTQISRFLERLDNFGILGSTLCLISSDMGDPSLHSLRNVPMILAGGASGRLRMGLRLAVDADCPPSNYYCKPPKLTANNHLLVSIAQAFGVQVNSYGTADTPDITTGALSGLT